MGEEETGQRWQQRFSDATAWDRLDGGWPERTQEEQTKLFQVRSTAYMKLMITLDEDQLPLLQEYAAILRAEQEFWNRRSFYLGYNAKSEEKDLS